MATLASDYTEEAMDDVFAQDPDAAPAPPPSWLFCGLISAHPDDKLPKPLLQLLLQFDSQVFGVVVAFPVTFTMATCASALAILITLQLTIRTLPVAVSSFVAANLTAVFLGRRVGGYLEEWHYNQLLDHGILPSSIGPGSVLPYSSLPQSDSMTDGRRASIKDKKSAKSTGGGYQSTGTDEEDPQNVSRRPIIRRRAFRPMKRNFYFQITFITIIVIANVFGMIIGSMCAENFYSRLRDR